MKRLALVLLFTSSCMPAGLAQSYPPAAYPPAAQPSAAVPNPVNTGDPSMLLSRIEQETQGLNADVGKLRVEKWKTDSATRQQAAENAASIQRNVSAALPGLISAVRAAPQSLAANFKLYRNLNALYDVVASLGESTGAFGKREEYDTIAPHVAALDEHRRSYADYVQQMAAAADNRIAAAQQAQAAAAQQQAAPKKIIVDDAAPSPPVAKKKRVKKAAASSSSAGTSTPK